ncbi:ABC transporter permease [Acidocella aquatica]|uniref:ABC transporter permease n=1 Tax=Acidocella aquatica TaxID=1922313 RepID=A0ABQ6A5Y0_9PROT|nr:ABC transporter permease [Acidocella aquatica]GLR65510.1 ABC transporter permease [Acidocella aquatica]
MLMDFARLGWMRWLLCATAGACTLFLLAPLVLLIALSFDSSPWLQFPPPGWTLQWYAQVFHDPDWLASFITSLEVGSCVTVLSVLLGLLCGFAITRGQFRGREILRGFFLTPMILPSIVLGIALYSAFLWLHIAGSFAGFVIAHLVLALPFSVVAITGALEQTDKSLEDAAMLCGAGLWEARVRVILPAIRHGLFGAALFSFLTSWDEVVVAIFMASPTLQTLPVRMLGELRQDLSPDIAVVSSLLVLATALLMGLAALFQKESAR